MGDFMDLRARHLAAVRAHAPQAVQRLDWDRQQVVENQRQGLRRVVAHARTTSPYYAARLDAVDALGLELENLSSLPILTKDLVMQHWDDIVTDPRLSLDGVIQHLQELRKGDKANPYLFDTYYAAATGGSSGKRGVFLWDWESFVVTANITNRLEFRSDLLDKPHHGPKRTVVICANSDVHASHFLFPAMLDPERDVQVITASTPLQEMVQQLNEFQPDRLVGYASIVQELAALAMDGDLQLSLNRIATNSEPLLPEARRMAQQAWGIDIHNSWGSVELGVVATEGDSFSGLTLAEDYLIFEFVDAHYQPVPAGERAERVLVTKLFGQAFPLLRYEMTDSVRLDPGINPDAEGYGCLLEISGRNDDWFVYAQSIRIHPMLFRSLLGQVPAISEYQVHQTPQGARILVIGHGDFNVLGIQDELEQSLAKAGLPDPQVVIQTVMHIPRHEETGKLKRFVPLEPRER